MFPQSHGRCAGRATGETLRLNGASISGETEAIERIWPAPAGWLKVLIIGGIGVSVYGRRTGWLSALVRGGCPGLTFQPRGEHRYYAVNCCCVILSRTARHLCSHDRPHFNRYHSSHASRFCGRLAVRSPSSLCIQDNICVCSINWNSIGSKVSWNKMNFRK